MVPVLLTIDKCILDVVNRARLKENEESFCFKYILYHHKNIPMSCKYCRQFLQFLTSQVVI